MKAAASNEKNNSRPNPDGAASKLKSKMFRLFAILGPGLITGAAYDVAYDGLSKSKLTG